MEEDTNKLGIFGRANRRDRLNDHSSSQEMRSSQFGYGSHSGPVPRNSYRLNSSNASGMQNRHNNVRHGDASSYSTTSSMLKRLNNERHGDASSSLNPSGMQNRHNNVRHGDASSSSNANGMQNRSNYVRHGDASSSSNANGLQNRSNYVRHGDPYSSSNASDMQHRPNYVRHDASNSANATGGQRMGREMKPRFVGFRTLEELALEDPKDILTKLNMKREGFMTLVNSNIDRLDIFVLIIRVLAKVSLSPFIDLKSRLLLDVTNSNFILALRNYLMDLPYPEKKSSNNLYWNNQPEFWRDFLVFCEEVHSVSPSTAISKCRALIESVSKTCLDYLKQRHEFVLPQEYDERFTALREKLTSFEELKKSANTKAAGDGHSAPPEDFRELSLLPTVNDLLVSKPFLRPNIVKGGYTDVQHYLDVQFRLLREDCFGPLRDGINQYLADSQKRKYDHVRIFHNVKFICPYIANLKIGTLVQLDTKDINYFKKVNWAHNKRFLFGSLVIFTKDRCKNFVIGTILDRDVNLLSAGKLPVALLNTEFDPSLYNGDAYTMIESEVYFEPYYHVMKALQAQEFTKHLAMQDYIVKVEPRCQHPKYLNSETEFVIYNNNQLLDDSEEEDFDMDVDRKIAELIMDEGLTVDTVDKKFKVLQTSTWPTKDELKLNQSQYDAFQLALTREFAVIQGPPGTGKTYVGIKVATTLLQNVKYENNCIMLIVCYTNHALDQFLEAISKVTKSIVRIGGQSRNEALDNYNLNKLRKDRRLDSYFLEERNTLRRYVEDLKQVLMIIDVLNNGVIKCAEIEEDVAEIKYLRQFYSRLEHPVGDPLFAWLFENVSEYSIDFNQCIERIEAKELNNDKEEINDKSRTEIKLEDDHKNNYLESIEKVSSFSITHAQAQLKQLLVTFKTNQNASRAAVRERILELSAQMNLYHDQIQRRSQEVRLRIHPGTNFLSIPYKTRWRLYFMWINNTLERLNRTAVQLQTSVTPAVATFEEARLMQDVAIIKERRAKVVGMTTSGAAKMRKLLQAIAPKIVIVEEAAEVLEQHITTSLTKDCQHLILIGDHQQLRPSASHMKLAKQYNIEVSLFERMITNGMHSRRLKVQHRMRPEIASLICPLIYPDLENHPSVEYFPKVKGIECNLFFFSHNYLEEDSKANDSSSKTNHKEADLTLSLANYLMQQGYDDEDVTILAAYSGQMFYMRRERHKYAALAKVKITVVDNYQGEESRIILLSLVRNNSENKIGFLGIENRICVALSRAKEGFYIFGNMNLLKSKSELWVKIATTLENNKSLGENVKLRCQNHPNQITQISTVDDFTKVPEGGCLQKCNFDYSCGHRCLLFCHGYDRDHVRTKCTEKCERIICELKHVCPLKCRDECQLCQVMILKTLPCEHEMKVPCHLEPEDPQIKCRTVVDVTLPDCGHKTTKLCFVPAKEVKCTVQCVYRIKDCGHACSLFCHVTKDPEHEKYVCYKPCARAKKGCTANLEGDKGDHQCLKGCFEECSACNVMVEKKRSTCKHVEKVACSKNIDDIDCKMKCSKKMPCGHFCKKKCFEPCGGCMVMVEKEIPGCQHKIKIACMTTPSRELCKAKCERLLSCGHPCTASCGAECGGRDCTAPSAAPRVRAPCGHDVQLPCYLAPLYAQGKVEADSLVQYCGAPCGVTLACLHACGGSCARCAQGRLHAPCQQTCNQLNICGHQCQEKCNQVCPPCTMMCEIECQHSRCNKRCGEPCTPCQEQCSRRCKHSVCRRRCGVVCAVRPCDKPCGAVLPCKHKCSGLCGEPCPPCRRCQPDRYPETGFIVETFTPEHKFVLLQDCGHILEVEDMDTLMKGDQDSIEIRKCPYCRKPIFNTNRYKDIVNNMLKNEINPIKRKIYGTQSQIIKRKEYLTKKIEEFIAKFLKVITGRPLLNRTTQVFKMLNGPKKRASLLEIEMSIIYLGYLEMITECCAKYEQVKTEELNAKFENQVKMLLTSVLQVNVNSKFVIKISEQQQTDANKEIKRLNAIIQLSKILKETTHIDDKAFQDQIKEASKLVFSLAPFDEDNVIRVIQAIKSDQAIQKYERAMVVKAMGFRSGHWFKCPNGHFYCIGECGGANQVSKCMECGATVGGTNHALTTGNQHAPEMDGSAFPAYSEAANNFANFNLDNLL